MLFVNLTTWGKPRKPKEKWKRQVDLMLRNSDSRTPLFSLALRQLEIFDSLLPDCKSRQTPGEWPQSSLPPTHPGRGLLQPFLQLSTKAATLQLVFLSLLGLGPPPPHALPTCLKDTHGH